MSSNYVPTPKIKAYTVEILDRRLKLHAQDLDGIHGAKNIRPVKRWYRYAWAKRPPNSQLPGGVVLFEERRFERAEQDTGFYGELDLAIRIYDDFSDDAEAAALWGELYGDAVSHCLFKESRMKRPKDSTVLPGLFRINPLSYRYGDVPALGLFAVEVKAEVIIDTQETYAE